MLVGCQTRRLIFKNEYRIQVFQTTGPRKKFIPTLNQVTKIFLILMYVTNKEDLRNLVYTTSHEARDSVVGTATRYGLDGPDFESRWEVRF